MLASTEKIRRRRQTIGLDLAKNVFQVHGVNEHGTAVLRKQLRRDQVVVFFANLPTCLVGMEACGSAHHWARKLQSLGHTVKLMSPQFVNTTVSDNLRHASISTTSTYLHGDDTKRAQEMAEAFGVPLP